MTEPLFFKVARLRPDTLLKKELWHRCFSLNLLNFQEHFFTEQPQMNVSEKKTCDLIKPQFITKSFLKHLNYNM